MIARGLEGRKRADAPVKINREKPFAPLHGNIWGCKLRLEGVIMNKTMPAAVFEGEGKLSIKKCRSLGFPTLETCY
jgi:hypothetical protein